MTPDSLAIVFVAANQRRADAARRRGNPHIEGSLVHFGGVIMRVCSYPVRNFGSRQPVRLRRREYPSARGQVRHKSTFDSWSRPRGSSGHIMEELRTIKGE